MFVFTIVGINNHNRVGSINLKGDPWVSRIIYGIPKVGMVPAENSIVVANIGVIANGGIPNDIKFHECACH
jgi:hypothetical protein